MSVFPVPGGPTRITPLGILAPTCVYFPGFFRKSTISARSSFSSSRPATFSKVTGSFPSARRARLLPKFIIFELAPPFCRLRRIIIKTITPASMRTGRIWDRNTFAPRTGVTYTATSGYFSRTVFSISRTSSVLNRPVSPLFSVTSTSPVG